MRWVIRAYVIVLLFYTGWRTYDFMVQQLPKSDISFWLAILFLFATEAGLFIWHEVSINHTSTYTQHYLSTTLTWLDFAGSLSAGIADMIIRQTLVSDYVIPPVLVTALIYGLPIIVAINVAGALVYLANDAELVEERERRFLSFEAYRQASRALKDSKSKLVASKKKELYRTISGEDLATPALPANTASIANTNGHHKDEPIVFDKDATANPTLPPVELKPRRK